MALKLLSLLGCCGKGEHKLWWSQRELPCGEIIQIVRRRRSRPLQPEIADEGYYAAWYRNWVLERVRPEGAHQRQVTEALNTGSEERVRPYAYRVSPHLSLNSRYACLHEYIRDTWSSGMYGEAWWRRKNNVAYVAKVAYAL